MTRLLTCSRVCRKVGCRHFVVLNSGFFFCFLGTVSLITSYTSFRWTTTSFGASIPRRTLSPRISTTRTETSSFITILSFNLRVRTNMVTFPPGDEQHAHTPTFVVLLPDSGSSRSRGKKCANISLCPADWGNFNDCTACILTSPLIFG